MKRSMILTTALFGLCASMGTANEWWAPWDPKDKKEISDNQTDESGQEDLSGESSADE